MGVFNNVNLPNTGNPNEDFRQYKLDLERRIRHALRHIDAEALILGLTANRLTYADASAKLASVNLLSAWIAGTSGNLTVTDDGAGGVILKSIGSTTNVTQLTDTTTLTIAQQGFIECNKASAMTVNLPTAVGNAGVGYSISSINSGTVTIDPNGSETIQGDSTIDIYEDENLTIVSNGTNWTVG